MPLILWFGEISKDDVGVVGGKGANLGEMYRAGFPVPPGFCVTVEAYLDFLRENQLEGEMDNALTMIAEHNYGREQAARLRALIAAGTIADTTRRWMVAAYQRLQREADGLIAVRSSATAEDLPQASFAGQGDSYLNVADADGMLERIKECWASLWTERAILYRSEHGFDHSKAGMAVVVQQMVQSEVSGVAFSVDPMTGEDVVVIEASWGLAEAIVQGEVDPDRYVVDKKARREIRPAVVSCKMVKRVRDTDAGRGTVLVEVPIEEREKRALSPDQVRKLAETLIAIEDHYGAPQDVEWGFLGQELYVFQARPITTAHREAPSYFTDDASTQLDRNKSQLPAGTRCVDASPVIEGDDLIWTSGFMNERFPEPVSPLGWSIIKELVEEIAFKDPLRFMGYDDFDHLAITKLYRGHPFVNLEVFKMLYKPFPDALLPDDAYRYFPGGDTSLRKEAKYPPSRWHPRFLLSVFKALCRDPANWSPLHNYKRWASYAREHDDRMRSISARLSTLQCGGPTRCEGVILPNLGSECNSSPSNRDGLTLQCGRPNPHSAQTSKVVFDLLAETQRCNRELLKIHRWSLTHADLFYTALRKIVRAWVDGENQAEICSNLVSGMPNKSVEIDRAIQRLAMMARQSEGVRVLLSDLSESHLVRDRSKILDEMAVRLQEESQRFLTEFQGFLDRYGHRSFSLDIFHPSFADDPTIVLNLIKGLVEGEAIQDIDATGERDDASTQLDRNQSRLQAGTRCVDASQKARRLARKALSTRLLDRLFPLKRFVFEVVLALACRYIPLREDQRFYWQKSLAAMRKLYLLIGDLLVEDGLLDHRNDVFFATKEEIEGYFEGNIEADVLSRSVVRRREEFRQLRREYEAAPNASYPNFLRGNTPLDSLENVGQASIPAAILSGMETRPAVLKGRPVSAGLARGKVVIISTPRQFSKVAGGDILVTRGIDPGWTPIFGRIGGLIMESGGQLSHASVVAREYGIPAVVGIANATRLLEDGQVVLLDGLSGTVRRLE